MLASTGSRLALAAGVQGGGGSWEGGGNDGNGTRGGGGGGGGLCDAAFSQPLDCLDAALAAQSHQAEPAAVVPTPGITMLASNPDPDHSQSHNHAPNRNPNLDPHPHPHPYPSPYP